MPNEYKFQLKPSTPNGCQKYFEWYSLKIKARSETMRRISVFGLIWDKIPSAFFQSARRRKHIRKVKDKKGDNNQRSNDK